MSKSLRIIIGGAILALMLVNYAARVVSQFSPLKGSYDGWSGGVTIKDGKIDTAVTRVDQDGPAKELRQGDQIIAVNGVKIEYDTVFDHRRGCLFAQAGRSAGLVIGDDAEHHDQPGR